MAMVTCGECQKPISNQATSCPHCGIKRRKSVGPVGIAFALVFMIMVYKCSSYERPIDTRTAQEREQAAAAEKVDTERLVRTGVVMTSIKATLREPDSVQWISAHSNGLGTVVCVEYRARNGFGGMSVEHAVLADGILNRDTKRWNKRCSEASNDSIRAVQFLPK